MRAPVRAPATKLSKSKLPMGFFTMTKPRPNQAEAIERIAECFDGGGGNAPSKFVFFEGPCGSGKSACSITLGRYYGSAYICTLTKNLQDQYVNDKNFIPHGIADLKGRSEFKCRECVKKIGKVASCKVGGHLFKSGCVQCPYRLAKAKALAAPLTVCNYHSFIYNVVMAQGDEAPEQRPLLILDEAHELERVLMDHVSVRISRSGVPIVISKPIPKDEKDVDAFFDWLVWLREALKYAHVGDVERQIKQKELLGKIGFALASRNAAKWIVEPDEALNKRESFGFILKPITIAPFTRSIFGFGQRVLLMSATILDAEAMAMSLGIDGNQADFVQVPSTFPASNRPVVAFNVDMHKENRVESWPVMIKAVTDIMRFHGSVKGLILATSNEMLTYLKDRLPHDCASRLLLAYGEERDERYKQHCSGSKPTVLAASGMWEGIDLAEDLSRFTIIPALPRPFLSAQVKARSDMQLGWYRWCTMTRCVQGLGRGVRSDRDQNSSYVLDADFAREMRSGSKLIPNWLREAVEIRD